MKYFTIYLILITTLLLESCSVVNSDNRKSTIKRYIDTHYTLSHYKRMGCPSHLIIPNGFTFIENNTFSWNDSLISVTLPSSMTSIGSEAFSQCHFLRTITIPETLQEIGSGAFSCCFSLDSITLPSRLKVINKELFNSCESLRNITIPDSVSQIYSGAFAGCTTLDSLVIPHAVDSIGSGVFAYSSLKKLISNSPKFSYVNGALLSNDSTRLIAVIRGAIDTHFDVPSSVKVIGEDAFEGCRKMTSAKLPEGLNKIEDWAFFGCFELRNINIPSSVTQIGEGILDYSYNLKIDIKEDSPIYPEVKSRYANYL